MGAPPWRFSALGSEGVRSSCALAPMDKRSQGLLNNKVRFLRVHNSYMYGRSEIYLRV